jgi:1,4-alpha-glucan branching enzyme
MADTLMKKALFPSEFDRYLFHEGNLFESYKMLGAHFINQEGVKGVRFAVWAPNARRVAVVGDFNRWNGMLHPMERIPRSGIWVLFIPELTEGERYKYEIQTPTGETLLKADPFAFYAEKRPDTASRICTLKNNHWHDQQWMEKQKNQNPHDRPMLIYEVHPGTWKKKANGDFYTYRELAESLINHVKTLGVTHIELMPIMEHPYDRSWGYQITGYYAVTSRFGTPEDFMYFVDQCHQNGIGVILDWVPAHFCKDVHGLGRFDGTPLYEPIDPLKAERPNWGTYNFDFAKPEVVSFLISNIMFWIETYHIDGFRVDAVSSMIYLNHDNALQVELKNQYGGEENLEAIAFLKKLNDAVHKKYPNVLMIAEEATAWPKVTHPTNSGGLGFDFKWNMGWTNDLLNYIQLDEEARHSHHNLLTFSLLYAFSEKFILPFSHDELVYGKRSLLNKMPGDYWKKFANLRLLYGYLLTHPGKKLIFMGSEFAQFDEWKDEAELDFHLLDYESHREFLHYFTTLNQFFKSERSLWQLDGNSSGFEWIDPHDSNGSVITFIRKGKQQDDFCIVVCNFSSNVYHGYQIGVPAYGKYKEVFNSDWEAFGGSHQVNHQSIQVKKEPYHNQRFSMEITVPPLGITIFKKKFTKKRGRKVYGK